MPEVAQVASTFLYKAGNKVSKKQLRNEQLKKLNDMNKLQHEQKSYQISTYLFQDPQWEGSETVAITVSKHPEINTWDIIKKGWLEGKKMVVPKCTPKTKELIFYELGDFEELEKVYYDLYEPNPFVCKPVHKKEIDLVIVPGLAFNGSGFRLGFGGGYYDRFLMDYEGATLSLAYKEQIVNNLPTESFDIPVQQIIVENGVINCE
jgi:5-formyltetrahydrofolate cyclo-ligase